MSSLELQESAITFEAANVFQFDFASNFWFGSFGQQDARAFVHIAADPDAAQQLFDALLEEQSNDYKLLKRDKSQVLLQHNYLSTYFVLALRGPYIYGLETMPADEPIEPPLARLTTKFSA